MTETNNKSAIERKASGAERFFARAPFSTVTMVAHIMGWVSQQMLIDAVTKIQQRHTLLQMRFKDDSRGDLWFTPEGVHELPIAVIPRKSANDWVTIHAEACKAPYDFEKRPPIRFLLVQSKDVSDLIILCHHVICDGLSLAYLVRDLMIHLGDPSLESRVLPSPQPISLENLPADAAPTGLINYFIKRIKQKWDEEMITFDQDDYEAINKAYWENFHHEVIPLEFSEEETTALVRKCREENVTVNSALITAFSGAQKVVMEEEPHHAITVSAASLRERLPISPGEGMGYYALGVEVKFRYNPKKCFWENTRIYHKKINANTSNKKVFGNLPTFLAMDSNIYEALNFKKLGKLVKPDSPRYEKLNQFAYRDDVVVGLLKRAKMESLEAKLIGPAITNLGRLDFPKKYGNLALDRLIIQPGGAFPLVHVDMVIGAVTCAGKMSLVIEYAREAVGEAVMKNMADEALRLLMN